MKDSPGFAKQIVARNKFKNTSRKSGTKRIATLVAVAFTVAACGSTATSTVKSTGGGSMTIGVDNGSPTLQKNFNPFSSNMRIGTTYMYEPLEYVNTLNGKFTPFLATGHHFVNNTTLQFDIRSNMKWSDGKPITASDVVFTFNLLHKYPALDVTGIWNHLNSVTSSGNVVTFHLNSPDVPFAQIIAQTLIVPQHIWASIKNPVTFTNNNPVVSGPYVLSSFNPNQYILKKNPNCWQASHVAVPKLIFPAMSGGQTSQLQLSRNAYSWATLFVPNIKQSWVDKAPKYNKYWFPPGGSISLFLNLAKAPFNNLTFRQALSDGLNRQTIATKAENGYVKPASQTGLLLPGLKKWLNPSYPNKGVPTYNVAKAMKLLSSIGYHKNGNTLLSPNGSPVKFSIIVPNGFSDWISGAQTVGHELGRLGISVTVSTPQFAAYQSQLQTGQFQAAFGSIGGNGNPYLDFHNLLASSLTAPIGQSTGVGTNYERWKSTKTDALLNQLLVTTNPTLQKKAVYGLEKIMYTQLPVLTLFYGATWGEYSTKSYTGWPSAANPYAPPAPYGDPPIMIMTHLHKRA